jgi:phosphoglycerate dehydrogenase-like enzyme
MSDEHPTSGHRRGSRVDQALSPTPHLGGLTPENADAQARSAVEQVAAMIARQMPLRVVNESSASRLRSWWAAH